MRFDKNMAKRCADGCGRLVNPGKRYIRGHSNGLKRKNPLPSPPQPCACGCKRITSPGKRYISGHNPPWNKGSKGLQTAWNKNLTKETDGRVAKYAAACCGPRPSITGELNYMYGKIGPLHHSYGKPAWNSGLTKETDPRVKQISDSLMGIPSWNAGLTKETNETLMRFSINWQGERNPVYGGGEKCFWFGKPKEMQPFFGKNHTEKWRIDSREWLKMGSNSPNKPEKKLLNLLEQIYPGQWNFTGDFTLWINNKNPDFANLTQKKLIEVFGEYWHKGDNPQDRIDIFKPYGWDTLIIWEHELRNLTKVKFRIRMFMKRKLDM